MVSRAPIKSIKKHFAQFVRANCDPSDFFFLIDLRFRSQMRGEQTRSFEILRGSFSSLDSCVSRGEEII